jgi:hypothetical protein
VAETISRKKQAAENHRSDQPREPDALGDRQRRILWVKVYGRRRKRDHERAQRAAQTCANRSGAPGCDKHRHDDDGQRPKNWTKAAPYDAA